MKRWGWEDGQVDFSSFGEGKKEGVFLFERRWETEKEK
jgi:hypothetical protein